MTDEQIIKALEAIEPTEFEKLPAVYMEFEIVKEILDLIKRQQVEIEDLIKQRDEQLRINRQVVRRNGKHVDERNRLKSKLEKEVDLNRELFEKMAKDEAEIERLTKENKKLKHEMSYMSNPYTIGDRHEMGG